MRGYRLPSSMTEWKSVLFQNHIMFLKCEGNNEVHARRERGERKKKRRRHSARERKSRSEGLFSECRAVDGVIVPIVSHEAGRNVWPALWETPLKGPHLSQPGDLNSATDSSMARSWQTEICFFT